MPRQSFALLLIGMASLAAEGQSVPAVTVRGTVLDAVTSSPISGAQLTLTGMTPSVLPTPNPSPVLSSSRVVGTDGAGAYEIRNVAAGSYQLFVRRLGYQAALVDLDVGEATRDTRLSFGLLVIPIRLEPVTVEVGRADTFGRLRPLGDGDDSLPVFTARARQTEFLSGDVRDLTAIGSLQGGGLGETDLLRALRRFPGITGKDDHSAELWVRGARWDQVRISYDGMPMFNPFHASETVTGIPTEAIGAAFLHPGVRPVSLLSQGPSLIDIRSRAATDTGSNWFGAASRRDVSIAYETARADGRSGWMVSGRRSLTSIIGLGDPRDHDLVGEYSEITLRRDARFGNGNTLEVSALRTQNSAMVPMLSTFGSIQGELPVRSDGLIYRATLNQAHGRIRASHTLGVSAYNTSDVSTSYPLGVVDTSYLFGPWPPGGYYSNGSSIDYLTFRGDLRPAGTERWRLGYELYRFHTSSHALQHSVSWSDVSRDHFNLRRTRVIGAMWSEGHWNPAARLTVNAGARLESTKGAFKPRLAPSAQARLRVNSVTHLSLGASRSFQDAQEIPFSSTRSLSTRGFWFLSGTGFPVLRADQASAGIERWFGNAILFDANAFARRLSDVAVRPLPSADTTPQPLLLASRVDARGLELGLRKLAGQFTGSIGYTLAKSTERIEGVTYDASGDRRHELDATAMWHAGRYRFGSAFTYMTGAPYTQFFIGRGYYIAPDSVEWHSLAHAGPRNARRLPHFASLDLFAERSIQIKGRTATPYAGIQNALNRRNLSGTLARDEVPGNLQEQPDILIMTRGRHLNVGFRIDF